MANEPDRSGMGDDPRTRRGVCQRRAKTGERNLRLIVLHHYRPCLAQALDVGSVGLHDDVDEKRRGGALQKSCRPYGIPKPSTLGPFNRHETAIFKPRGGRGLLSAHRRAPAQDPPASRESRSRPNSADPIPATSPHDGFCS